MARPAYENVDVDGFDDRGFVNSGASPSQSEALALRSVAKWVDDGVLLMARQMGLKRRIACLLTAGSKKVSNIPRKRLRSKME